MGVLLDKIHRLEQFTLILFAHVRVRIQKQNEGEHMEQLADF